MKHYKTAFLFVLLFAFFTGCSKEEKNKYNLTVISPYLEKIYNQYTQNETETNKYILQDANDYSSFIDEKNSNDILSITICDNTITDESVTEIINICKEKNIPIFFLMKTLNKELLSTYDKAFCITTDYNYAGELFAEHINTIWTDTLKDKNSDKILNFTVITPETLNTEQQIFNDSFIKNMELLGIPLQKLDELYLSNGDIINYCKENNKSEAFIILDSNNLKLFTNYTPNSDGVEVLGFEISNENIYLEYPYMNICFIDFDDYFNAKDKILSNINQKIYPFENLNYNFIDKTIYINPTI